jgi:hypothetical protein
MKTGDKVVCIDDVMRDEVIPTVVKYYKNWVKRDDIYTVRDIVDNDGIVFGILLHEIRNERIYIELIDKVQEPAFGMFRFRVVQESEHMESVEHYVEMV